MNARYAEKKEARIAQMIATLVIDVDGKGTFATVQSASNPGSYRVSIDESKRTPVATSCQCLGHYQFGNYCQHMEAVDRFFVRIYAWPVVTDTEQQQYLNYLLAIGAA